MATVPVADFGVVKQAKIAFQRRNRIATTMGFILGGFVPIASYVLAHVEAPTQPMVWILVTGGLIFSAKTVFDWARIALRHPAKALGFVVLTEGIMTFAHTLPLSLAGLAMLVAINGIATGCNLVNKEEQNRKGGR